MFFDHTAWRHTQQHEAATLRGGGFFVGYGLGYHQEQGKETRRGIFRERSNIPIFGGRCLRTRQDLKAGVYGSPIK